MHALNTCYDCAYTKGLPSFATDKLTVGDADWDVGSFANEALIFLPQESTSGANVLVNPIDLITFTNENVGQMYLPGSAPSPPSTIWRIEDKGTDADGCQIPDFDLVQANVSDIKGLIKGAWDIVCFNGGTIAGSGYKYDLEQGEIVECASNLFYCGNDYVFNTWLEVNSGDSAPGCIKADYTMVKAENTAAENAITGDWDSVCFDGGRVDGKGYQYKYHFDGKPCGQDLLYCPQNGHGDWKFVTKGVSKDGCSIANLQAVNSETSSVLDILRGQFDGLVIGFDGGRISLAGGVEEGSDDCGQDLLYCGQGYGLNGGHGPTSPINDVASLSTLMPNDPVWVSLKSGYEQLLQQCTNGCKNTLGCNIALAAAKKVTSYSDKDEDIKAMQSAGPSLIFKCYGLLSDPGRAETDKMQYFSEVDVNYVRGGTKQFKDTFGEDTDVLFSHYWKKQTQGPTVRPGPNGGSGNNGPDTTTTTSTTTPWDTTTTTPLSRDSSNDSHTMGISIGSACGGIALLAGAGFGIHKFVTKPNSDGDDGYAIDVDSDAESLGRENYTRPGPLEDQFTSYNIEG